MFLATFILALALYAALAFFPAIILWAVYTFVLLMIFPALPIISIGQMYLITLAITIISGLLRSSITIKS